MKTADTAASMNGRAAGDTGATSAQTTAPLPLEWKFSQVFGERTAGEEVQEGIDGSFLSLQSDSRSV